MAFADLSAEELAKAERYGGGLGEKAMAMANQVGESLGAQLYMFANVFGDGLTEERISEQIEEMHRIFEMALQKSPLGIGDAMLKDPEIMEPLYSAAEAAMLGRYQALVDNLPGGAG